MIKNRSFIIGIGIGIIVGAILLQLMNIGKGQTMMSGAQLTPEQLQEAAQAQNMQVFSSDQKVYTSEQWKQLQAEEAAKKEAQKGNKASSTKEPTAPTSPQQPKAATNESTSQPRQPASTSSDKTQSSKSPSSPESPNVSFTINPGENLNDVAFSLKKEGLINSQSEFINKASERKANTKLQVGTFEIGTKQDYNDIISIITGQPSS